MMLNACKVFRPPGAGLRGLARCRIDSAPASGRVAPMKAFFSALLLTAGLLCPWAHAQQDDAARLESLQKANLEKHRANAEKGDAYSQKLVGISYLMSALSKKPKTNDYMEAAKWFFKSAEQGDAGAQGNLAVLYEEGNGVAKDFVEAYAWYNLSSLTSKDSAQNRDDLEKKMTPQQIADAQKRTKELRAMVEAKANAKAAK
jgi:TPR repeat protein